MGSWPGRRASGETGSVEGGSAWDEKSPGLRPSFAIASAARRVSRAPAPAGVGAKITSVYRLRREGGWGCACGGGGKGLTETEE